jgi:acyl carrier protein
MGLEIAEFTMEIEDIFGIELPEDEPLAAPVRVKDVAEHIHYLLSKKRDKNPYDNFAIARHFFNLRRILQEQFSDLPPRIRPSTPLTEAIPHNIKINQWHKIHKQMSYNGCILPSPIRSKSTAVFIVKCVVAICGLIGIIYAPGVVMKFIMLELLLLPLQHSAYEHNYGRIEMPENCETIRDLLRQSYITNSPEDESIDAITQRLREILADQLCMPITDIHDDSGLIDDLGMG